MKSKEYSNDVARLSDYFQSLYGEPIDISLMPERPWHDKLCTPMLVPHQLSVSQIFTKQTEYFNVSGYPLHFIDLDSVHDLQKRPGNTYMFLHSGASGPENLDITEEKMMAKGETVMTLKEYLL